jgi:biotin transport system substrate-specific component
MSRVSLGLRNDDALKLLKCLIGAGGIAICSQIYVPFFPVPLTLQTIGVLFTASILGARYGTIAILIYLAEGIAGLPVFAGFSSGLSVILGPTGGYLIGFVLAAYLIGSLMEKSKTRAFSEILIIGVLGDMILLTSGYLQLALFVGYSDAYTLGIMPFILGDLLKLVLFALLTSRR